jgi:amino acid transporter
MLETQQKSFLKKFVPAAAFIAGLCCFTPIVLVLFGLGTVSAAASLSDTLYGQYKWAFRGLGLFFLLASVWWYFYKVEKVCSWDEAVKKRNRIINFALLALIIVVVVYVLWLYVILHYIGVFLNIWK